MIEIINEFIGIFTDSIIWLAFLVLACSMVYEVFLNFKMRLQ